MTQPNPSTALATVVIDELVRSGVDYVVVSPGSRSTALAVAAELDGRVEVVVAIDERSAGFHALGRAKASGRPVAAISTSGTAPANYYPAVVEADMSLVPLMVVSADRPLELRGVGSNQTIDQRDLYGHRVRAYEEIDAPSHEVDGNTEWRARVSRAAAAALGADGKPGPVQINIAFREPTVPVSDDGRVTSPTYEYPIDGRPGGESWQPLGTRGEPDQVTGVPPASKGLIVAGDGQYDRVELRNQGLRLGWPILASCLSGMRGDSVVWSYHHMLADGVPATLKPELVLTVGSIGPSQRLETLVASAQTRIRIDRQGRHFDPSLNATAVLTADPALLLSKVVNSADDGWQNSWLDTDRLVQDSILDEIGVNSLWSGPKAAHAFNEIGWRSLVVGSSLPIRDIDALLSRKGRVIANRGASGIDGLVSTAMGVASASTRTAAFLGDVSLLHDSNGFLVDRSNDLVLVAIDNGGGGLFDTLPQAKHAPAFERLFIAPHGRDLAALARFHGIDFVEAHDIEELVNESNARLDAGGVHLIRVAVDRAVDVDLRHRLDDVAGRAVQSAQP